METDTFSWQHASVEERAQVWAPWLLKSNPQKATIRRKHLWVANTMRLLFDLPLTGGINHVDLWCTFLAGFLWYLGYAVHSSLPLLLFMTFKEGEVCFILYVICFVNNEIACSLNKKEHLESSKPGFM